MQILKRVDLGLATEFEDGILRLKNMRELISYFAPSSGDNSKRHNVDVFESSRFLLEVAQLQSELVEASVLKNATGAYALEYKWIQHAFYHFVQGNKTALDSEDRYRMDYLCRKYPKPTNIYQIISEGHMQDFFGAWCAAEEHDGEDVFDPDEDWGILFDVP